MEKFRCSPTALPRNLYRVQYPRCQTQLSGNGLAAKDTKLTFSDDEMDAFGESITNQLTWHYRGAQPFITCFSDHNHAENWALKEPWNPSERDKDSWSLLTIDTRLMPETYVLKLENVVAQLGLEIPERATQHVRGAYLCLHTIPTSAIVNSASTREVKEDVEDRKWQETYHPLDGYSGSDREAVENNLNDDIVKMIEGDWD